MGGGLDKARRHRPSRVAKYDLAKAHLILARVAEKQKQYDEAESQLRAGIKDAKNPADAWLELAAFYRERGRLDDMQKAVQSALAQPDKPAVFVFRCRPRTVSGQSRLSWSSAVLAEVFVVGRAG